MGSCTSMSIGSFSVDCPQINGTEAAYTTILAASSSSQPFLPSTTSTSTSSVPIPPVSTSQQHFTSSVRISKPLSSTILSLHGIPPSLLQEIGPSPSSTSQPPPLPSTSPSPSPSSSSSSSATSLNQKEESGNDGGLSGPSTIAIGVVLPGIAVLVAIVFGVRKWKNS